MRLCTALCWGFCQMPRPRARPTERWRVSIIKNRFLSGPSAALRTTRSRSRAAPHAYGFTARTQHAARGEGHAHTTVVEQGARCAAHTSDGRQGIADCAGRRARGDLTGTTARRAASGKAFVMSVRSRHGRWRGGGHTAGADSRQQPRPRATARPPGRWGGGAIRRSSCHSAGCRRRRRRCRRAARALRPKRSAVPLRSCARRSGARRVCTAGCAGRRSRTSSSI